MESREELEAALAEAEVDLARAVAERGRANPGAVEADAHVDRVRAHCRQTRAALDQLKRGEGASRPPEKSTGGLERAPARPSERSGTVTIDRLLGALPERRAGARRASSWRMLARQALMLFALVVAYLQYYFLDVQLQVSRLPSIFG